MISAGTATGTDPAMLARLRAAYAPTTPVTARTQTEITEWFTGFSLIRPGLADVRDWRPLHRPPPRCPSRHRRPGPGTGAVVDSVTLALPGRRPSRLMLSETEWSLYPGGHWEEDPPSEWTAPVFSLKRLKRGHGGGDGE